MNPLVVQGAAQLLLGKYKSEKGMFMKNIVSMAATGLVIFACLGWYLDWYKVARTTTPDGKQHIDIDINTKRIESDWDKARNQATSYLNTGGAGGPSNQPSSELRGIQPTPAQAGEPICARIDRSRFPCGTCDSQRAGQLARAHTKARRFGPGSFPPRALMPIHVQPTRCRLPPQ